MNELYIEKTYRFMDNVKMNKKPVKLICILLLTIVSLHGCIQDNTTSDDQHDTEDANKLTDEDWAYFVFHYTSGEDLHTLYSSAGDIISNELYLSDSANYTYLIELNMMNQQTLNELKNISEIMTINISRYQQTLLNFTLSEKMKNHSDLQTILFNKYQTLSDAIFSIYTTINSSTAPTNTTATVIDISKDMVPMLPVSESITDILDSQVDIITLGISDEEWDAWTKDRDWSFMD
jgi:hypothetical protein